MYRRPQPKAQLVKTQLERATSGLANTTIMYLVVKISVPNTTAPVKATMLLVQLKPLLALVVAEVTVARQNLRVGSTTQTFVKSSRITNLSNKSLSMETV